MNSITTTMGCTSSANHKPGVIHACVDTHTRLVRIVRTDNCKADEKEKQWNVHGQEGSPGPQGTAGLQGPAGPQGPVGPAATTEFAEFFALMPPDNGATVAVGAAVSFPQNGPQSGGISRLTSSTFVLSTSGTYRVSFVVSVDEAGQLALRLNGVEVPWTVVGRATGTSQIVGEALVETTSANAVLEVVNPTGNSTALTVTPIAGGTHPVSASLVIQKLQ